MADARWRMSTGRFSSTLVWSIHTVLFDFPSFLTHRHHHHHHHHHIRLLEVVKRNQQHTVQKIDVDHYILSGIAFISVSKFVHFIAHCLYGTIQLHSCRSLPFVMMLILIGNTLSDTEHVWNLHKHLH